MFTAESVQKLYKRYDNYPLDLRFCKVIAERFNRLYPIAFSDLEPELGAAIVVYDPQDDACFVLHYNGDFNKWLTRPRYTHYIPIDKEAFREEGFILDALLAPAARR